MTVKRTIEHTPVPVHIWTEEVTHDAVQQLEHVAHLPFVYPHVAAMPDVHPGIGASVGSVIPTRDAIVPAAVGVDIGCGMIAARLSIDATMLPDSLSTLRSEIEARVPVGFHMHDERDVRTNGVERLKKGYDGLAGRVPALDTMMKTRDGWQRQLGTLGGGNHFIEVCLDELDRAWVMLHSGSRGIGNRIGRHFIALAREEMLALDVKLPDRNLAYLREGTESYDLYVQSLGWAQDYASENRVQMLELVLDALRATLLPFEVTEHAVNCHHNYVAREHYFDTDLYITRKGAIRAGLGELGIIPARWGRSPTSCVARATRRASAPAPTARDAGCRAHRRRKRSARTIWSGRPPGSSAGRMRASLMRSRPPTRTSTR